jgi:hypothetical protein
LEAKLNVDADEEAGEYQVMSESTRPIIPRMASNRAQLHIAGSTIPSKLKSRIREAFTVQPYLDYAKVRHKWTDSAASDVNWKAFNQATSRFQRQHNQIVKLSNDLLPTLRWANRYDSLVTDKCLLCGSLEDRDHILQCSHPSRHKWRHKLFATLQKNHNSAETDPQLLDILIDGLDRWFRGIPFDRGRYPQQYHTLIQSQTAIGWRHLFNGHLSLAWQHLQDSYIRQRGIRTIINTGTGWTLKTIMVLWTNFVALWTERNSEVHGHDQASQQVARFGRLRLEMEHLHQS